MTSQTATIDPVGRTARQLPLQDRIGLWTTLFGKAIRATHVYETGSLDPQTASRRAYTMIVG